jgi:NAD(P)-dependent dehydrogenase (short-subunit alcohol dehydrogenase family)
VAALAGKVALVTGAASGIGAATKALFEAEGAGVLGTDIRASGELFRHDVTDEAQWAAAVAECVARFGRLDILVSNAGTAQAGPIVELDLATFREQSRVHVEGAFLGMQAAVRQMRQQADACKTGDRQADACKTGDRQADACKTGDRQADACKTGDRQATPAEGSIIVIASVAGLKPIMQTTAYGTAKAALINMAKAVGVELGRKGDRIRVNAICPGGTKTAMTLAMFDEEYWADKTNFADMPLKDYCRPEDVADACLYLASDESAFMTANHITVDGGWILSDRI